MPHKNTQTSIFFFQKVNNYRKKVIYQILLINLLVLEEECWEEHMHFKAQNIST